MYCTLIRLESDIFCWNTFTAKFPLVQARNQEFRRVGKVLKIKALQLTFNLGHTTERL